MKSIRNADPFRPLATPQPPLSHHSLGAEPTAPQSTPRPVSAPGPRKGFRPGILYWEQSSAQFLGDILINQS